jgi:hypothetical protein
MRIKSINIILNTQKITEKTLLDVMVQISRKVDLIIAKIT